jgi:membrane protein YdbS with pleckstrin-like domain
MEELKIRKIYLVKSAINYSVGIFFGIIFFIIIAFFDVTILGTLIGYIIIAFIVLPISFLVMLLRFVTFSYWLTEDFINVKQGVITRSEKHIPFSVIQDVIVNQDILDRFFGLSTVIVENAAMGGAVMMPQNNRSYGMYGQSSRMQDFPGMYGNRLVLPGFSREDAIKFRDIILSKAEEASKQNKQQEL